MKGKLFKLGFSVAMALTLGACAKTETHLVKFDTNGGSVIEDKSINDGAILTEPEDPTKDNMNFAGWYIDNNFENEFSFSTTITSDITLYAKWVGDFDYFKSKTYDGFEIEAINTGLAGDIVIPSTYEGKNIVAIAESGFSKTQVTSVRIESGVKYIGDDAFNGCSELVAVDLGSVETVGSNAFENAPMTFVTIPSSVKSIGNKAFYFSKDETSTDDIEYVFLSSTNPTIENSAFLPKSDFIVLEDAADLKANLATVASGTTYNLDAETASYAGVYVNDDRLVFVSGSFNAVYIDSDSISKFTMATNDQFMVTIGTVDNVGLLNKETKKVEYLTPDADGFIIKDNVLYDYVGTDNIVYIPEGITTIGEECGAGNTNTRLIIVPDSVTEIKDYAFFFNSYLQCVWIGTGIKTIGDYAFAGSSYLGEVKFEYSINNWKDDFAGLESVGTGAFYRQNGAIFVPSTLDFGGYLSFYCAQYDKYDYRPILNENNKATDSSTGEEVGVYEFSDFITLTDLGISSVEGVNTYKGVTYKVSDTETILLGGGMFGIYTKKDADGNIVKQTYGTYSYTDSNNTTVKFTAITPGEDNVVFTGAFDIVNDTFKSIDEVAGTFKNGDSIITFNGYGKAQITFDGVLTNDVEYSIKDGVITFVGFDSISDVKFEDGKVSFKDKLDATYSLTKVGQEAGIYYDISHGSSVNLDGNGNATVIYDSVTYNVTYKIEGSSIKMTIGESSFTLSYNSKDHKLSGYFNDDYNNPTLNYAFSSIGSEAGTYTNDSMTITLDGFFNAKIVSKETTTMNYFKVSETSFILYDADLNVVFITISGSSFNLTAKDGDLSGVYYSAGSNNTKWDSWIFTPDGYIVYKFQDIGTYTYESGVLKIKYKHDTDLHEIYISDDLNVIEMKYNYYGDTYNYLFKQVSPLSYTQSFYSCVVFTSATESTSSFTTYILDNGYVVVYEYGNAFTIFAKPTTTLEKIVAGTTFEITGRDGTVYTATCKDNDGSLYIEYVIKA
jgi:uncharacterized repeat protein (TIGR02543 family)